MYQQFVIFFLLLLTGYVCKRYHILTDAATNAINKFVIMVAYPCLILARTTRLEMDHRIFVNFLLTLFITFGLLLLFGGYARLYCKLRKVPSEDAPVSEFSIMSPNNGFMGFPIAVTFFGSMGLLYMVACNVALNTMFFTYGIAILRRGRGVPGESVKKKVVEFLSLLVNPKVSAAIVGIILCYNHIALPELALTYLDSVGAVATPMAMISIGTFLSGGFGLSVFKSRVVMEGVIAKLIVVPIIGFLLVYFLPLDPSVRMILIVANLMPVAATVPILAEQYGRNKQLGGEMLVVSTIFSMGTIPLGIW
ncbi:MAG: AEC family transporter, partial [Clostridiales Family XIII bacterium]|nr:AEC family transporter [Clostridiales Family XIII bacterium]